MQDRQQRMVKTKPSHCLRVLYTWDDTGPNTYINCIKIQKIRCSERIKKNSFLNYIWINYPLVTVISGNCSLCTRHMCAVTDEQNAGRTYTNTHLEQNQNEKRIWLVSLLILNILSNFLPLVFYILPFVSLFISSFTT